MTESTQLQTTENNNAGVVKMEPPLPTSTATPASIAMASPAPTTTMEQQLQSQQHQQQYALKWNDFQSSILNSFRHLRDEEDFVDVTLACNDRSFTAHKVVLSACSPYFRKLLKSNPCEHPIVILRDVIADDVENLLSFMYNGEVNVSHEHLSDFLKTAHLLQIRGLADVNSSAYGATNNRDTPKTVSETLSNNNLSSSTNLNLSNKLNFLANAQINSNNSSSSNPFAPPSLPAATSLTPTNNSLLFLNNNSGGHQSNHNTPAIQELKASSASPSNHHWDLTDVENNRNQHLTPPPQKRIKSADLFRAQHGISPERLLLDREFPVAGQHPLTRERHRDRDRDRSRETSRDRDRNLEFRESLLGQALENNNVPQHSISQKTHGDVASMHAQSAGEDSDSSDTEPSDRGDGQLDGTMDSINSSLDNQRSHSFPSAFLGLQGIPGLLPGPSSLGASDFVSRRTLEMRVRATDPRPCPKCGKIYRSAHTLRTHLEDKHTVCPGYRCVLCGTVAKSRNSLHSHMSRQHRGISTKDLPVLPMPSAFDPELASRLLAKAGVKISPAELRARASPTNGGNGTGSNKLDLSLASDARGGDDMEDSDDDPEDLTTGTTGYGLSNNNNNNNNHNVNSGANELSRYHESLLSNFSQANTTISRMRNEAAAAAAVAALGQQNKDMAAQVPNSNAPGQSLLDTYLQFIAENPFAGMGMSQEHAAAAALHAAKIAQLNALGHGFDKMPSGFLPPQFDLSKLAASGGNFGGLGGQNNTNNSLTIETTNIKREQPSSLSPAENGTTTANNLNTVNSSKNSNNEQRRENASEPMEMEHNLLNSSSGNNIDHGNAHSGSEQQQYSDDESPQNS